MTMLNALHAYPRVQPAQTGSARTNNAFSKTGAVPEGIRFGQSSLKSLNNALGALPQQLAFKPETKDRLKGALRGALFMTKARLTNDVIFATAFTLVSGIFSGGLSLVTFPFTLAFFMTYSALSGAFNGFRKPEYFV